MTAEEAWYLQLKEALAIQLFLKYEPEINRPWGQCWPDEKEKWLKDSDYIIENLRKMEKV